ncbi:MAG TPA: hypothetical protein VKA37_08715 [Halobacteriales archaeon]|nr:hypothetical protein [Halobacteriales archaeon]
MSSPTGDEDLGEESEEELERRAGEARGGENTVSFGEYRGRRDDE